MALDTTGNSPPTESDWLLLLPAVRLAGQVVTATADGERIVELVTEMRTKFGTMGERGVLDVLTNLRGAAIAQFNLANAAIDIVETCTGLANDAALSVEPGGKA